MYTRRYCAFISYRHTDNSQEGRRWAEWLHRALERFVVPPDLAGTSNQRGEIVPASLYPIFRDEDELPANADLATGIRAALELSDHLIVLCSPRSAVSPWVRKEVREFKELGRSDRLLAIMLAGEPNADDPAKARDGILLEEECLCHELRFGVPRGDGTIDWSARTEPLAADLRPGGMRAEGFVSADAYREHLTLKSALAPDKIAALTEAYQAQLDLGLLKVIAGLLGVHLSQITERDAAHRAALAEKEAVRQREIAERERQSAERLRRRNRILSVAALIILALAFALIALASSVERARDKAVAAQNAADDLIIYMQYDLSETLGKFGSLTVMNDINGRIRRYHEQHPPDAGDTAERDAADRERAVALGQHGDLQRKQGALGAALDSYRDSLRIRHKLVAKFPDNDRLRRDLSVGSEREGDVLMDLNQLDAALQSYSDSLDIRQKLANKKPDDDQRQRDLSVSFNKVGNAQKAKAKTYKEDNAQKAKTYLDAAFDSYSKSLAIRQKLADKYPDNTQWQRDLSVIFINVGDVKMEKGDIDAADASFRSSLTVAQRLAAKFPEEAQAQIDLAINFERAGNFAQQQKRWAQAAEFFGQEVQIARPWLAKGDAEVQWLNIFAYGAGKRLEVLRDAPAEAVKLDRDALFGDLRTARDRMKQVQARSGLIPPMDMNLPWIESLLTSAETAAKAAPAVTPKMKRS